MRPNGLCDRRPRRVDHRSAEPFKVVDFGPGDVWYFPARAWSFDQGIGHEDCLFILVFDNGYFSEFGTFGISDWLGHIPPEVLQKALGVPAQRFANFPKREVYIAKGVVPPPLPPGPAAGSATASVPTHRYRLLEQKPEEYSGGTNRLVSQVEFPISTTMTGAHMRIKPGGIREPHWHPNADEWQYYIGGRASMSVFGSHGRVRTEQFGAGDVGYVPQGYGHYIENTGTEDLDVVVVFNNGTYESISLSAWLAANPPVLHELRSTGKHSPAFQPARCTFRDETIRRCRLSDQQTATERASNSRSVYQRIRARCFTPIPSNTDSGVRARTRAIGGKGRWRSRRRTPAFSLGTRTASFTRSKLCRKRAQNRAKCRQTRTAAL